MDSIEFNIMAACETSHWWFFGRRVILASVFNKLVRKKNNLILDIGCGTGGNIGFLKSYGCVSAVEPNSHAISIAKNKGFHDIKKGSLPDLFPTFDKKFDIICLFDVLEHLENHQEGLVLCRKMLKIDGKVVITVPAFNFLWSQHDEVHNHKRRYTKADIFDLISEANLNVVYCSYFNFILFPVIFFMRFWKRFLNLKNKSDLKKQNQFLNTILKHVFSFERFLIPRLNLPFGVSIIVVAQNSSN